MDRGWPLPHTDAIFRPLNLFRRRAHLLQAIWHTPVAVAILDVHALVEQFNPAMEALLGYPSAAWKGAPFGYFSHSDEGAAFRTAVGELLSGARRTAQMERRLRRRDGGELIARVALSAITSDGRRPSGLVVTCENLTAQRCAERALHLSESHLRDLFDVVPIGLFHAGPSGDIVAMNTAMRSLLQMDRHAPLAGLMLGHLCADAAAEADVRELHTSWSIDVRRVRTRLRRTDGRAVRVALGMRAVVDSRGNVAYHEGQVVESNG